jgi:hypothetical protein
MLIFSINSTPLFTPSGISLIFFQLLICQYYKRFRTYVKFWKEIRRFQEVDLGSPGTYRSFTLVSNGLYSELQPLINGLRRIRDSYDFYADDSGVKCNSFIDFVKIIQKHQKTREYAQFLLDKVQIQDKSNTPELYSEALFNQSLLKHLPEYQNLPYNVLTSVYKNATKLITNRLNKPITRLELENALRAEIDSNLLPLRPITLYIDLEYRDGKIWSTDAHPTTEIRRASIQHDFTEGFGDDLVVSIGILRDIANDVESNLSQHGLEKASRLHIKGTEAITSLEQANATVQFVKNLIAENLTKTKNKKLHLFIAVPAFFALFLGHRLNATAPVQCYEWISPGKYVPTCCLFSDES